MQYLLIIYHIIIFAFLNYHHIKIIILLIILFLNVMNWLSCMALCRDVIISAYHQVHDHLINS